MDLRSAWTFTEEVAMQDCQCVRNPRSWLGVATSSPPVLRALLASVLVISAIAVLPLPAAAQTSDVGLTIDPTVRTIVQIAGATGGVSCSSTTVDGSDPLSASIQQGPVAIHSDLGFAFCDPSTGEGSWTAVFFDASQLHPGSASVTVRLALDDGTTVSATGSVRIISPNVPIRSATRIDDTYIDPAISLFCGFPVQAHDVGLVQNFRFSDALAEKFVGSTTFTNLNTGTFVVVETSNRFTFSTRSTRRMVFVGLNYRIRTSSGMLVSAGRGVLTVEDESATPHLTHLSSVLCGLLR
jgi:hypothetical protein